MKKASEEQRIAIKVSGAYIRYVCLILNKCCQAAIQNATTLEEVNRIEQQLIDHPGGAISATGDAEMKVKF